MLVFLICSKFLASSVKPRKEIPKIFDKIRKKSKWKKNYLPVQAKNNECQNLHVKRNETVEKE